MPGHDAPGKADGDPRAQRAGPAAADRDSGDAFLSFLSRTPPGRGGTRRETAAQPPPLFSGAAAQPPVIHMGAERPRGRQEAGHARPGWAGHGQRILQAA